MLCCNSKKQRAGSEVVPLDGLVARTQRLEQWLEGKHSSIHAPCGDSMTSPRTENKDVGDSEGARRHLAQRRPLSLRRCLSSAVPPRAFRMIVRYSANPSAAFTCRLQDGSKPNYSRACGQLLRRASTRPGWSLPEDPPSLLLPCGPTARAAAPRAGYAPSAILAVNSLCTIAFSASPQGLPRHTSDTS